MTNLAGINISIKTQTFHMKKIEKTIFAPLSAAAQNISPEKHLHIGNKTCILLQTPSC